MISVQPDGNLSHPRCVSELCRLPLDPAWKFCPYCGKDNRPPENKKPIRRCRHYWPPDGAYCVGCGRVSPKYEIDWENMANWGLGVAGGVGLLLLGYARLVNNAYHGKPFLFIHRDVPIVNGQPVIPGSATVELTDIYLWAVSLVVFAGLWFFRDWLPRNPWRM